MEVAAVAGDTGCACRRVGCYADLHKSGGKGKWASVGAAAGSSVLAQQGIGRAANGGRGSVQEVGVDHQGSDVAAGVEQVRAGALLLPGRVARGPSVPA